jgi:hypothetical protein
VPTKEALDIFIKAIAYLSDLMTKRKVLIVASYFPYEHSRRRVFLESVLFGRASTVTRVQELKGQMQFKLEKHPFLQPFIIDVVPNAATLEKFVEA